jgi:hypothetical protein
VVPAPVVLAGDRYEVGALLGHGGGQVYRGFDRALCHQVAIKVLHSAPRCSSARCGCSPASSTPT